MIRERKLLLNVFLSRTSVNDKITTEDIAVAVSDVIGDLINDSPNEICALVPLGALITIKLTERLFKEDEK